MLNIECIGPTGRRTLVTCIEPKDLPRLQQGGVGICLDAIRPGVVDTVAVLGTLEQCATALELRGYLGIAGGMVDKRGHLHMVPTV